MKSKVKYMPWSFLLGLLTVFLCSSCIDEDYNAGNGKTGAGDAAVTFSLLLPGNSTPKTYALDGDDENRVKTIDILLFATDGKYKDTRTCDVVDNTDQNRKTFTVKLIKGTWDLVLLANSRAIINQAYPAGIPAGTAKAEVLAALKKNNDGKWSAKNSSEDAVDYLMPMWGGKDGIDITDATTSLTEVPMVRMMVKIDVVLTEAAATGNLKLTDVYLYNPNTQGSLVPQTDDTHWDAAGNVALMPNTVNTAKDKKFLHYTDDEITTTDVACAGEIYTFEADKAVAGSLDKATCLVIGGKYGTDTEPTYYRVDFAKKTGTAWIYLDLLRNHHYKVNIKKVSGRGFPTKEDAFNSLPVNIEVDIIPWNDGEFTETVFDGQYRLDVSKSVFTLASNVYTDATEGNKLTVYTDYPDGWTVDKILDKADATGTVPLWLKTSISSGNAGTATGTPVFFVVDTKNETGASRTAYVYIKAGRMSKVLTVTQTDKPLLSLMIQNAEGSEDISELLFINTDEGNIAAKNFWVKWAPASMPVNITGAAMGGKDAFVFSGGSHTPGTSLTALTSGSGQESLSITPLAFTQSELDNNPFLEKLSKIDFTVFNGQDYLSKSIFLRHINYALTTTNLAPFYLLTGGNYSFQVRANAAWRIKSVTPTVTSGSGDLLDLQASDNLRVGTTGGNNTDPGTTIRFRTSQNTANVGYVEVTFEGTESPKKFNDVTVKLNMTGEYYPEPHSGWAGSNIYWDGSKLTFDDVGVTGKQNYQGVYFKWGSLSGISPEGEAWSDNSTAVYKPNGSGYSVSTSASWTDMTVAAGIPYKGDASVSSNPPDGKTERDRAYLYEITSEAAGIGDICKYLTDKGWAPAGKKWRMPTSNEFEAKGNYSVFTSGSGTANSMGTASFTSGRSRTDITPLVFIPAAGLRHFKDGALSGVGSGGYYWSASPFSSVTNGYNLGFLSTSASMSPAGNSGRANGFAVRCVAE